MPTVTPTRRAGDMNLKLVREFPLRRLRSDAEYRQAKAMHRRLPHRAEDDPDVFDYVDVLVDLIMDYEKRRSYFDTSHLAAAHVVQHLPQERRMSINALARAIGMSQSDLSNMLNGKRDWSKSAIVKLSKFFGINPALFFMAS